MLGDGLCKFVSVLEQSYSYETDQRLRAELKEQWDREAAVEELQAATKISDNDILIELIDCGIRADTLHVVTLVPLVHVAWANGYVERAEREEIMKVAEAEGLIPDSKGFQLLQTWLKRHPDPTLVKTWRDYIGAIQQFVGEETFNALRDSTMTRATAVAESTGGILGFCKISSAEQSALDELRSAFE